MINIYLLNFSDNDNSVNNSYTPLSGVLLKSPQNIVDILYSGYCNINIKLSYSKLYAKK